MHNSFNTFFRVSLATTFKNINATTINYYSFANTNRNLCLPERVREWESEKEWEHKNHIIINSPFLGSDKSEWKNYVWISVFLFSFPQSIFEWQFDKWLTHIFFMSFNAERKYIFGKFCFRISLTIFDRRRVFMSFIGQTIKKPISNWNKCWCEWNSYIVSKLSDSFAVLDSEFSESYSRKPRVILISTHITEWLIIFPFVWHQARFLGRREMNTHSLFWNP